MESFFSLRVQEREKPRGSLFSLFGARSAFFSAPFFPRFRERGFCFFVSSFEAEKGVGGDIGDVVIGFIIEGIVMDTSEYG